MRTCATSAQFREYRPALAWSIVPRLLPTLARLDQVWLTIRHDGLQKNAKASLKAEIAEVRRRMREGANPHRATRSTSLASHGD